MRKTRSQLQSSTRLLAATRPSPNQLNNFDSSAGSRTQQTLSPCVQDLCLHDLSPTSRVYISWHLYSLICTTPPPLHQLMFQLQTVDSTPPPFLYFYCFDKPAPNPITSMYTYLSLYPFNCTRNSIYRHLTKCRSYWLEKFVNTILVKRNELTDMPKHLITPAQI